MKAEKQALWLISIMNILLVSLLVYSRFFWSGNNIDQEVFNKELSSLQSLNNHQKVLSAYQLFTNGMEISSNLELQTENGDKVQIENILSSPTLVLRFSELNCQSCVDIILKALTSDSSFNETNTLLLGTYRKYTDIKTYKRINRINLPIFSIEKIGLPPDSLNLPYLYILDQNKQVNSVFIPQEGDTASIRLYLSFVSKKLGNHL